MRATPPHPQRVFMQQRLTGMARDPGGRRYAHTLDAQARDLGCAVSCPAPQHKLFGQNRNVGLLNLFLEHLTVLP